MAEDPVREPHTPVPLLRDPPPPPGYQDPLEGAGVLDELVADPSGDPADPPSDSAGPPGTRR